MDGLCSVCSLRRKPQENVLNSKDEQFEIEFRPTRETEAECAEFLLDVSHRLKDAAEMSNISNLIRKARNACTNGETHNAKKFVLMAIIKANTGNQRPLTVVQQSEAGQQLTDLHWGYSFVMNQSLHADVRKICSEIMNTCDFDDAEALAIWAKSLYMSGDYDLALKKNKLAIKYCKDFLERKRLEEFQEHIKMQLASISFMPEERTCVKEDTKPLVSVVERHIQTSTLNNGSMSSKPVLISPTNEVELCLQHTDSRVSYPNHNATRPSCEQHCNVKRYLERWLPIMLMESEACSVRQKQWCCIDDLTVKFTSTTTGEFTLSYAHYYFGDDELLDTLPDNEEDDNPENVGKASSYYWLCLRTSFPVLSYGSNGMAKGFQSLDKEMWIGHAEVTNMKKIQDGLTSDRLKVSFSLHETAPAFPPDFNYISGNSKFTVEILRKLEEDMRTENFMKTLTSIPGSLASKIATNQPVPDLDQDHLEISRHIERDLFYDIGSDDKKRRPLSKNNIKQQEAIDKALTSRFSLIQGPPGTNSSLTGIKLVCLFIKINIELHKHGEPKKHLMICCPSAQSMELIAEYMLSKMGNICPNFICVYDKSTEILDFPIPKGKGQFRRRNTKQTTSPVLYPAALHHVIRKNNNRYATEINYYDKLFRNNCYNPVPDQMKRYADLVSKASIHAVRDCEVVLCTMDLFSKPEILNAINVQQLIVYEAATCTEPQCLVPIIATQAEQVVLIGDHLQLRPVVRCKEAGLLGLETSLFERYAMTKASLNVKFTMLEEQYRMHPEICRFPSNQFYNGKLMPRYGALIPSNVSDKCPHIFIHVEGEEKTLSVSTTDSIEQSKFNEKEIDQVMKVFEYLNSETQDTIQILSQFTAQVSEIKRRLRADGFVDENVTTIDSSQGCQWDYVVFSTVRSIDNNKKIKNPTKSLCSSNSGVITDQNQMNVALTCARKKLIIIGNENVLQCDKLWEKFITYVKQRGGFKTPDDFPPKMRSTRQEIMRRNVLENEQRINNHRLRLQSLTTGVKKKKKIIKGLKNIKKNII